MFPGLLNLPEIKLNDLSYLTYDSIGLKANIRDIIKNEITKESQDKNQFEEKSNIENNKDNKENVSLPLNQEEKIELSKVNNGNLKTSKFHFSIKKYYSIINASWIS